MIYTNINEANPSPNDVVIVGSGKSLIGQNLGSKIDSFNNIIRFGGSEEHLQQFKDDVGINFNVLFQNCNIAALKRLQKRIVKNPNKYELLNKIVFAHINVSRDHQEALKSTINTLSKIGVSYRIEAINKQSNSLVKKMLCNLGFKNNLYDARRRTRPSTGFFAIIDSLNKYENIYLCGFDQLYDLIKYRSCSPKRPKHFYNQAYDHRQGHNLANEAKAIHNLMISEDESLITTEKLTPSAVPSTEKLAPSAVPSFYRCVGRSTEQPFIRIGKWMMTKKTKKLNL